MLYLNDFLASVHYLNHPLLSGFSAFLVLLLGVFVISRDRKYAPYKVFFLMMLGIGLWFFGNSLSMYYFNNFDKALLWYKIGYTGPTFMAVTYYHFYLIYAKKRKEILYFLYFASILEVIFLWFSGVVGEEAYFLRNVGIVYQEISSGAYFKIFGMIKYIILSVITAISFQGLYKKEAVSVKKQRLKYLAIIFFILIMGATEWVSAFNIPVHIAWMVVPIFSAFLAYAILKYQLMDITVIVKKAFFYSIGIALVSGSIVGMSLLGSWFTRNIPGFQFWIVPVVAGFFAFIVGNIFWQKSKEVEKAYEIEKQAHEELRRLSHAKDEFVLTAQHHLRTPLSIIKGYLSNLIEDDENIDADSRKKYLAKTLASTNRLNSLVDELLDITQMEVGKEVFSIQSINIKEIINDIINELDIETRKKRLNIEVGPKSSWPTVLADPTKIKIALFNLIDNAIKYTPKGNITIKGEKIDNFLRISIKDTGIGINAKDIKTILSKYFERGEEAKKVFTTGRGIGLFIAVNIIRANDGKIYAKSQGINKGSEFVVELKIT